MNNQGLHGGNTMENKVFEVCKKYSDDLIKFTQELVKTRSYSDEEGSIVEKVLNKIHFNINKKEK